MFLANSIWITCFLLLLFLRSEWIFHSERVTLPVYTSVCQCGVNKKSGLFVFRKTSGGRARCSSSIARMVRIPGRTQAHLGSAMVHLNVQGFSTFSHFFEFRIPVEKTIENWTFSLFFVDFSYRRRMGPPIGPGMIFWSKSYLKTVLRYKISFLLLLFQ